MLTVTGIEETMELFQNAAEILVAFGFTRALSAAGNVVANTLEANTPIKEEDTGGLLDRGELRESIRVSVQIDSNLKGGVAFIGFDPSKGADHVAMWLEYGHAIIGRRTGTHVTTRGKRKRGTITGVVQPNPFMRRSADMAAQRAVDAFLTELRATIKDKFPTDLKS